MPAFLDWIAGNTTHPVFFLLPRVRCGVFDQCRVQKRRKIVRRERLRPRSREKLTAPALKLPFQSPFSAVDSVLVGQASFGGSCCSGRRAACARARRRTDDEWQCRMLAAAWPDGPESLRFAQRDFRMKQPRFRGGNRNACRRATAACERWIAIMSRRGSSSAHWSAHRRVGRPKNPYRRRVKTADLSPWRSRLRNSSTRDGRARRTTSGSVPVSPTRMTTSPPGKRIWKR